MPLLFTLFLGRFDCNGHLLIASLVLSRQRLCYLWMNWTLPASCMLVTEDFTTKCKAFVETYCNFFFIGYHGTDHVGWSNSRSHCIIISIVEIVPIPILVTCDICRSFYKLNSMNSYYIITLFCCITTLWLYFAAWKPSFNIFTYNVFERSWCSPWI